MSRERSTWVLGNFKQNLLPSQVQSHLSALGPATQAMRQRCPRLRIGIAPTYLCLAVAQQTLDQVKDPNPLQLLAQNVGAHASGAYTGEVGAAMLMDSGCDFSLIGHSERRSLFGERDNLIARKVAACAQAGLGIVLCVGESLAQREAQTHEQVVQEQLTAALAQFPWEQDPSLIVAYEPVWAIGTGKTATPAQAQEMHVVLRQALGRLHPSGVGRSILYGGSVKPSNAAQLLEAGQDIDGFLVGGASLDPSSFAAIAQAAAEHLSS